MGVLDGKIEPLHMSTGIGIRPQKNVVLILILSDDKIKIPTFKLAVENEVGCNFGVHPLKMSQFIDFLFLSVQLFFNVTGDFFNCYTEF